MPQEINYAYGFDYTTDAAASFGATFDARSDITLGWTAEVSDLNQFDITYLVLNPMVFIQAMASSSFKFWTPQFGAKLSFEAVPYRFTALDF